MTQTIINPTPKDYKSEVKPTWCPGCGDFGVLNAAYRGLANLKLSTDQTVVVSGIGCSSRFPHFIKTFGFHSVHGRALPVARSEEHTSELQSRVDLVCRLLLEK